MASGLSGVGSFSEDRKEDFQSISLDYNEQEFSANYSSAYIQKVYPLVQPNLNQECSVHTFEIGSEHDTNFIDLQNIYANVKFIVTQADDTAVDDSDNTISIINNIDHSLFASTDVFINGTLISDHGKHSSLRNYITNLLSTSEQTKRTSLSVNHWLDDDSNADRTVSKDSFDSTKPVYQKALMERGKFIKSGEVQAYFQPQFDLMTCPRLLPPGNILKLNFEVAESNFLLIVPPVTDPAGRKYKLRITSFNLEVQRCVPNQIALRHVEQAKKTLMHFPITRTQIRNVQVLTGQHEVIIPRLVDSSQMPYQLLMVPVQNYQFKYLQKNPYVWKSCDIKKANLLLNGASIPREPFDISKISRNRVYKLIMKALGHTELTGSSSGLSPERWWKSKFFLAWDLTGCWCAGAHNHRPTGGDLQLQISFSTAPATPINLYIIACYENSISILDKIVSLNYTV